MKYPFTNEGFVQLQKQLQQLDDQALSAEAAKIRADFSQWLLTHFELSRRQESFLAQINPSAISLYSAETAFAVENRLIVRLDKEKDKDEQGKIIWNVSSLKAQAGIDHFEATGTLTFYIRYTEV
ncbi:hypothetical protein [Pedobacter xixiisoli]|uniref:Uncharacterized protein n=1 Tax=Pedobacter xixiisoli TaxID=1476464 RepID=A0A285ZZN7_9SPHI|nr:hypothetical protein [Pedobacter xixiisoli]SOD15123.1 hypothetical protein SAMN06297358_2098 [Pedobacter xixiisoli]